MIQYPMHEDDTVIFGPVWGRPALAAWLYDNVERQNCDVYAHENDGISTYKNLYMYRYICVCVCVCEGLWCETNKITRGLPSIHVYTTCKNCLVPRNLPILDFTFRK